MRCKLGRKLVLQAFKPEHCTFCVPDLPLQCLPPGHPVIRERLDHRQIGQLEAGFTPFQPQLTDICCFAQQRQPVAGSRAGFLQLHQFLFRQFKCRQILIIPRQKRAAFCHLALQLLDLLQNLCCLLHLAPRLIKLLCILDKLTLGPHNFPAPAHTGMEQIAAHLLGLQRAELLQLVKRHGEQLAEHTS